MAPSGTLVLMKSLWLSVLLVGVAWGVSGCSSDAAEIVAEPTDLVSVDLEYLLDEAREAGASAEQMAVVDSALRQGSMSLDDVTVAFDNYLECLEEAGFTIRVVEPVERYPGFAEPDAQVQFPSGLDSVSAENVDRACLRQHYAFASAYYVGQPQAMDAYLSTFDAQRESIVSCLDDVGVSVDESASSTELLYAVSEARIVTGTLCWEGTVFSGYLPEGTEIADLRGS